MPSKLRTASWVLLLIVGLLALLVALGSASLAYRGTFAIAGVSISDVAMGREAVLSGLRGTRGTAAAWGAAWAVLFIAVVLGPYRRGDVATWWGILVSVIVLCVIAWARQPLVGVSAGTGEPLALLAVVFVGLMLDVARLRKAQ
jgi:hypothetical protein